MAEKFKDIDQKHLVRTFYNMYREDESLSFLSDSLLYDTVEQWILQDSKLNFQDWMDYYLVDGDGD